MLALPSTAEILSRRILDISYQHKLNYLSSSLSALPIVEEIYTKRKDDEVFIITEHAKLALYVVLEYMYGVDASALMQGQATNLDLKNHITCQLGTGLPIAIGYALANPDKQVYCMITDGECGHGSIWESLRFINEHAVNNLQVYVNVNGQGAYDNIDMSYLVTRLVVFLPRINVKASKPIAWPFASGVSTHHHVLSEADYEGFNK